MLCSSDEGRWGGFQGRPRREIFFFADGSVIFWSVPELEREMVLRFLRNPQIAVGHYDQDTVFEESELMTFKVNETNSNSYLDTKVRIPITKLQSVMKSKLTPQRFSACPKTSSSRVFQ